MQHRHQADIGSMCWKGPNCKDLSESHVQDFVLFVEAHTVDLGGYLGREDLVPAIDAFDLVAGVCKVDGSAEGMHELTVGCKVFLYCCLLY